MSPFTVTPRRWLLLPVGIEVRELDTNAFLAFNAAEAGWGAVLGGESMRQFRRGFPRGVVIDKNMGADRFLSLSDDGDGPTALVGPNDTGVVTGNPRFDLLRPDYRAVFSDRVRRASARGRPMILVNTKFSKANGIYSPDARLAKMRVRQRVRTKADEELVLDTIENHRAGLVAFTELVRNLSRRFPDARIVVRPHPYERIETWQESARTLPNVDVVREDHVAAWILAADVCIHTNCTTGIEAYLLDKPVISYRPVVDERFDQVVPNALSTQAFSLDDVLGLVETALAGGAIASPTEQADRRRLALSVLPSIEGETATARLLKALVGLPLPTEGLAVAMGPRQQVRLAVGRVRRLVRDLRLRGEERLRMRHARTKSSGVTERSLRERLDALRHVTGRFAGVKIVPFERSQSRYFCIYSETAAPREHRL